MYGEDSGQYRCEACGKEFDTERELREHVHAVGLVD
jgi:DNA-directed RNA polymerase subunit RPC12/RpoP